MGVRVALPAQNKGFPPPGRHDSLIQVGNTALLLQVGQFADVMDLYILCGSADLAPIRLEPENQFHYETGHRWPNFAYGIALADALGCTVDALRQPPERPVPKRKRGRPRKAQ